uniref:Uncharacterized protein n=1 Tax=Cyanidium caldarium TaxID=2771 RepID=O19881_CYACA|nr:hypothetical protein JXY51_pgp168 [Cyanidium caldarium]AAB82708.1 unknown [Cyanidium caldarium]WDB00180.1 phycobiliprotein lyase [Cyanidium caldarium]
MRLRNILEQYEGMWYIMCNQCYTRYNKINRKNGEIKIRLKKSKSTINSFSILTTNYPKLNRGAGKDFTLFLSNLNSNLTMVLKQASKSKLISMGSCEWRDKNIVHIRMYYRDLVLQETIFLTNNNLSFSILITKSKKKVLNVTFSSWIRLKSKTTLNPCD